MIVLSLKTDLHPRKRNVNVKIGLHSHFHGIEKDVDELIA